MQTKQLFKVTVFVAFVFTMYGCGGDREERCRTCTARYNGATVATKEACSADEEEDFKNQYHYAEVTCE